MKNTVLCFILIGLWSVMPLVQGETFEYECDILQRLDNLENTNKETKQLLVSQEVMLNTANTLNAAQDSKIAAQESKIAAQDSKIAAQESKIAALERKDNENDQLLASLTNKLQGQSVGFTMRVPIASPTSGQLTFSRTVSNVGGGYNVTTGVFTCSIQGYYYFSASLLKDWSYDGSAYCDINKNNVYLVRAYTGSGPTPYTGHYAAANSVYAHLYAGDNVTLASCSAITSFQGNTAFSGFLVTADVN